jgi:hypothetical protein
MLRQLKAIFFSTVFQILRPFDVKYKNRIGYWDAGELRVPTAARWDRERNCAAVCCAETDGTSHELVRGRKRVCMVSVWPRCSGTEGLGFRLWTDRW